MVGAEIRNEFWVFYKIGRLCRGETCDKCKKIRHHINRVMLGKVQRSKMADFYKDFILS